MYFNARKYRKDMSSFIKKDLVIRFMNSWAIGFHGAKLDNTLCGYNSNGVYLQTVKKWNSNIKPKPLTEKEIKKFRGEI